MRARFGSCSVHPGNYVFLCIHVKPDLFNIPGLKTFVAFNHMGIIGFLVAICTIIFSLLSGDPQLPPIIVGTAFGVSLVCLQFIPLERR